MNVERNVGRHETSYWNPESNTRRRQFTRLLAMILQSQGRGLDYWEIRIDGKPTPQFTGHHFSPTPVGQPGLWP